MAIRRQSGVRNSNKNTHDKNGDEASKRRVPVPIRRRLAHQHTVEYEVAETQLYTTWKQLLLCTEQKLTHKITVP